EFWVGTAFIGKGTASEFAEKFTIGRLTWKSGPSEPALSQPKGPRKAFRLRGLQSVRENYSSGECVEHTPQNLSPVGAEYVSPGRKSWVQWKIGTSPGGTTRVLTHTLQPWWSPYSRLQALRRIPYNRRSHPERTLCPSTTFASGSPPWTAPANSAA